MFCVLVLLGEVILSKEATALRFRSGTVPAGSPRGKGRTALTSLHGQGSMRGGHSSDDENLPSPNGSIKHSNSTRGRTHTINTQPHTHTHAGTLLFSLSPDEESPRLLRFLQNSDSRLTSIFKRNRFFFFLLSSPELARAFFYSTLSSSFRRVNPRGRFREPIFLLLLRNVF